MAPTSCRRRLLTAFPFGEDFVQLLDRGGPLGGVEVVEGLVVVATSFGWLLASEPRQRFGV